MITIIISKVKFGIDQIRHKSVTYMLDTRYICDHMSSSCYRCDYIVGSSTDVICNEGGLSMLSITQTTVKVLT